MASGSTTRTRLAAAAILTLAAGASLARLAIAAPSPSAVASVHKEVAVAPPRRILSLPHRTAIDRPKPASVAATLAVPPPLVIRRIIDTGGPLRFGHWFWDDGKVPAGPVTITVDLKASVLSVFRDGYEIGTTAVIYGADAKETPLGTFPILAKDAHHFSSTYHHAPMPYTLRLTGDGVSIHGSEVAADYATHGCIGVPTGFARKLFGVASVGDRVIVTNRGLTGGVTA